MTKEKWTSEDELYLKNHYMNTAITDIAVYLNRTVKSIENKSSRLGLKKHRDWTVEEDRFMIDNYHLLGIHKCAEALDRSVGAIRSRANNILNVKSSARINTNNDINEEWLKNTPEFIQLSEYHGTKKKTLYKHLECGHEWYTTPSTLKSALANGTGGCPYCTARRKYSKVAIQWLNSLNNPNILHAENGGEQVILGFKVDGYDPTTNTVYEFHGDAYHGNLDIYSYDFYCHPYDKTITAEELWDKTFLRMKELSTVSNVIYIWENDFINKKPYCIF